MRLLGLGIMLGACGTVVLHHGDLPADQVATIRFRRYGLAYRILRVDGRKVDTSFKTIALAPGPHEVEIRYPVGRQDLSGATVFGEETLALEAEPGHEYRVEVRRLDKGFVPRIVDVTKPTSGT